MSEIRIPLKVFQVNYQCDDCGGLLKPTGIMLTRDPPLYEHKCTNCGKVELFDKIYGGVEYEPWS